MLKISGTYRRVDFDVMVQNYDPARLPALKKHCLDRFELDYYEITQDNGVLGIRVYGFVYSNIENFYQRVRDILE